MSEKMFCGQCGKQLQEGATFCDQCGAQVRGAVAEKATEQVPEEAVYTDQNVESVKEESEKPVQNNEFAKVEFNKPVQKKKKAKILIGAGAGVLALALILVLFLNPIVGFALKTFGSGEAYLKYVEKKAFDSYINDITDIYNTVSEQVGEETTTEGKVSLNVSKEALELLEEALGDQLELDWLNKVVLNTSATNAGTKQEVKTDLTISGKKIVDATVINDYKEQKMFLAMLSLSDQYLSTSTEDIYPDYETMLYTDPDFVKALPTDEEINTLLKQYLKIAIDNLDDVDKSTETLEVEGVKQKVTVLELTVDTDTVYSMAEDILRQAKEDEDLKEYIKNLAKYLEKKDMIVDSGDVYSEFRDSIKDALSELKDAEYDNEDLFVLTDYVNGSHEIIGRELEVEDTKAFSYISLEKGKNIAAEIKLGANNDVKIKGKGTKKGDKITAEYVISVEGNKYVEISVQDYVCEKEDGKYYLNGSVCLRPTKKLLEEADLEDALGSAASLFDMGLQLQFKMDKKTTEVAVNIVNKEKTFVGITLSGSSQKAKKISTPSDNKVTEDAEEWVESLDVDKIVEALKKAGVPEELATILEYSMGQVQDSYSYYGDYEDYYDDYDDYYDDYEDYEYEF